MGFDRYRPRGLRAWGGDGCHILSHRRILPWVSPADAVRPWNSRPLLCDLNKSFGSPKGARSPIEGLCKRGVKRPVSRFALQSSRRRSSVGELSRLITARSHLQRRAGTTVSSHFPHAASVSRRERGRAALGSGAGRASTTSALGAVRRFDADCGGWRGFAATRSMRSRSSRGVRLRVTRRVPWSSTRRARRGMGCRPTGWCRNSWQGSHAAVSAPRGATRPCPRESRVSTWRCASRRAPV
jgi:hypothetical protein